MTPKLAALQSLQASVKEATLIFPESDFYKQLLKFMEDRITMTQWDEQPKQIGWRRKTSQYRDAQFALIHTTSDYIPYDSHASTLLVLAGVTHWYDKVYEESPTSI